MLNFKNILPALLFGACFIVFAACSQKKLVFNSSCIEAEQFYSPLPAVSKSIEWDKSRHFDIIDSIYIYKSVYVEKLVVMDNTSEPALLPENARPESLAEYDDGKRSKFELYYTVIFGQDTTGGTNRNVHNGLFYSFQKNAFGDIVGFGKCYFGGVISNALGGGDSVHYLSGAYILDFEKYRKSGVCAYILDKKKSSKILFVLDNPGLYSDSVQVKEVVMRERNQIAGTNDLILPINEILGPDFDLNLSFHKKIIF